MSITLNKHYKFQFDPSRNADTLNGIYRVDRVLGYNTIVLEEVDIYTSLYKRLGKSESDLAVDLTNYLNDLFYKLTSTYDNSVVWVPESLIIGYPDPNVRLYNRVMLTTDLGVYDDPETLYHITRIVQDNLKHLLGLKAEQHGGEVDPRINPQCVVADYNEVWMSKDEYEDIVKSRDVNRVNGDINVNPSIVDYYQKWRELTRENFKLQEQIAALEEVLSGAS